MEVRLGYKPTALGLVPEDWVVTRLAGLVAIVHGFGFQSRYFTSRGKYRLTTPGNFYEAGGFRDLGDKQKFYDGPLPYGYMLTEGDLIVAMTEQADGLLGSAALVPADGVYLHNQRIGRVRVLFHELSLGFLYRVFNSNVYRAKVRETAAGTKVKHTSPSRLLEIPVALPPTKNEQETIAEVLSDVDALIESLEQLIAKKCDLKHAAMQALLTGNKRLPKFNRKWETRRIDEIVQLRKERTDPRRTRVQEFCIELEHIEQGTGCLVGHTAATQDASLKSVFEKGDVLFGKLRAYLRKYWLATRSGVCSTEIWVLVPKRPLLLSQFLFQLVKVDSFIEQASSAYGTHMPRSDWKVVRNYEVKLPSVEEQAAIAAVLTDMDAELATLRQQLAKTRVLKQGMMQELLTGKTRIVLKEASHA